MTEREAPSSPTRAMAATTEVSEPLSRKALWARIQQSSRDQVVAEEMVRLGFWPARGTLPDDPVDELEREAEVRRELAALQTERARLLDLEQVRKHIRLQRFAAAREKRKGTKEKHLGLARARAAAWREKKRTDVVYLGEGVSGGLEKKTSDAGRLRALGLPVLHDAMELSAFLGVSVGELRFLTFHRRVARTTHYRRFEVPKKTGGVRRISAPMPRLKELQRKLLDDVLAKLPVHEAAHGFLRGRSIVSGALPHVGHPVVINVDLENFFPTVTFPRVKGLYRSFGYGEQVATLLALLCTEPEVAEVTLDGQRWFVHRSGRFLPQGAPTSPQLTNLLCRRLDAHLEKAAGAFGFTYTRYADDLSFSHPGGTDALGEALPTGEAVRKLLGRVRFLVERAGFRVHPAKTRVMRKGRRREVTGVLVHDRPRVARERLRQFRAALHHLETKGPGGAHFGQARSDDGGDVVAALDGFASFVLMVDPEKGLTLKAELSRVVAKRGLERRPTPRRPAGEPPRWRRYEEPEEQEGDVDEAGASGSGRAEDTRPSGGARSSSGAAPEPKPKKPWWKFW